MSIIVKCQCGKKFKTKDSLAGRKVRCPGCRQPLRIPGGTSGPASPPAVDKEAALLKFEEAQKRKALDAETEAAYREEQNKLIESYDQVAGRTSPKGKQKKKGELTEGPVKKVTIFTLIADAFGAIFGTLFAKYVMIVLIASGAVLGSIYVVRKVTTHVVVETAHKTPKKQQIKDLYKKVGVAINEHRYSEANTMLQKILELEPAQENHRTYKYWRKKLDEAIAKG